MLNKNSATTFRTSVIDAKTTQADTHTKAVQNTSRHPAINHSLLLKLLKRAHKKASPIYEFLFFIYGKEKSSVLLNNESFVCVSSARAKEKSLIDECVFVRLICLSVFDESVRSVEFSVVEIFRLVIKRRNWPDKSSDIILSVVRFTSCVT